MNVHCNFCITKTRHVLVQILYGLLLALLLGLAFGFFVQILWNALLPDLWGWKAITYWQSVGLVILSRLIFSSHGYHKSPYQPAAACKANFAKQEADPGDHQDLYYEAWWQEEGKYSLERYMSRLQDKKK
jgi:hypothetical protein